MCTLQLPTREKSCCEEVRGGIERASGCRGFRAEMNSGPEAGSDQVQVPNREPKELWIHDEGRGGRRVQEGLCPSRHNVNCCCQFGIFFHKMSWVGGGKGEKFKVAQRRNPFMWKISALCWAQKCASSILRGGQRYEAKKEPHLTSRRIRSVCIFSVLRKPENPVGPTFS